MSDLPPQNKDVKSELLGLSRLFLKLGLIGFGGPAAHVAMMEDEVVRRRRWLSSQEFLDLVGATQLIPGPNSTELAIHIGLKRAGYAGLWVAGIAFILPAMLLVMLCAWVYVRWGSLPAADALLYGVKPVIIAVLVQALYGLGRTALKTWGLLSLGLLCLVFLGGGLHELAVLASGGGLAWFWYFVRQRPALPEAAAILVAPGLSAAWASLSLAASAPPAGISLSHIFYFFAKVGSVLFGSGYVLLAFLRGDLVERWGWLSETQLLDAIAIGQITPGPVFTTATFIGYLLSGPLGALVATCGIFLPAFIFVALSAPFLPRLRQSAAAGAFLDGLNVASWALMLTVAWQLADQALVDALSLGLGLVSSILLIRFRLNAAYLVAGGALLGLLSSWWR